MRPPEEVRKDLVRQWLEKAKVDINASEALLAADPPLLYPACFHAQQAAEKYLKALLTWHQIEFPKTHDIEQLLELVEPAIGEAISSINNSSELTLYGVDIRYPGDLPDPDFAETRRALELARKVRDTVLRELAPVH